MPTFFCDKHSILLKVLPMSIFCQLKQSLISQLETAKLTSSWQVLSASIDLGEQTLDGLSWLKAQRCFPHYFWQHRDQQTVLLAVGVAQWFETIKQADQFSHTTRLHVVGGVEFEGKAHFMLPRLLFVKKSGVLTAYCALKKSEKAEVQAFLQSLQAEQRIERFNSPLIERHSAYSFERWSINIYKAIEAMQHQTFDKVVLANATTMQFEQSISAYDLLSASRAKNQGCFHFLWSEDGKQTFIGSSPERLYQRQGRAFLTEALAGTVAVSDDPIQTEQNALWLLNDHKNIYENWLVVDDICDHLADCAADIQVSDAEIKRLRNVQHLRRKIRTILADNVCDADCLQRIHPTAAVAGLPRAPAKAFILANEGFERGWYAGTLGYIHPEQAEFCVTLRSALIQDNQITIYAGAGIVAESNPESEWQEIRRKALAMQNLLTE